MKHETHKPRRPAGPVIFRRYRRLKDGRLLDAHAYGHKAWPIKLSFKR